MDNKKGDFKTAVRLALSANKSPERLKLKPWITRPIIQLKRKAKRYQKKGAASNVIREVGNSLSEAIKSAKDFYFNIKLADLIKEDPEKLWNFIRYRKGSVNRILLNGTY